jgi:hypothetical protein
MHISSMPPAASHAHQSPAQQARDLLPTRDGLADQPFGKLVSMFARGEAIPSQAGNGVSGSSQGTNAASSDTAPPDSAA